MSDHVDHTDDLQRFDEWLLQEWSLPYRVGKRFFDLMWSVCLIPLLVLTAVSLKVMNPVFNPGPLLFRQKRMGRNGVPFTVLKFRTMSPVGEGTRGPNDPAETHRVTGFAAIIRKSHLDELPQILNILVGEMSFVGPRPDMWDHAVEYSRIVPNYPQRYSVRPGITGLAQVTVGYAATLDQVTAKTNADLEYIRSAGFWMDAKIVTRTVLHVLARG